MKGITQASQTVYNPATHGRNVVGNMVFMGANGMLPFGKGGWSALKQTSARIADYNDKDLNKVIGEMVGLGLADSSVTLGLVRDSFKRLADENKLLHKIIRPTGIPAVTLLSPKMEIITLSSRGFNHAFDKLLDILEENNE